MTGDNLPLEDDDADVGRSPTVDDLFAGLGSSSHDGSMTPPEINDELRRVHPFIVAELVRRWAEARDGSSAEHPQFRERIQAVLDDYPNGYKKNND